MKYTLHSRDGAWRFYVDTMKLNKIKKFKLFDENWTIRFYEGFEMPEDDPDIYYKYGECDSASKVICINLLDNKGKPLPQEVLETSVLHELMHAILDSGQYVGFSQNEPLVEWLAKCIRSLIKQKII